MRGIVANIQRFSTQDGPGLRTTVFLKGCPLRCPWCHNRETWDARPSLLYYDKDCVRCGECARVCAQKAHVLTDLQHEIHREACVRCGKCAEECPAGALELRGKEMTAQETLDEVLRDASFYRQSGGGVTFSGGEALLQLDFLRECVTLCKQQGLHVCIDTSGWGGRAAELAGIADLFLWDVKSLDAAQHKTLTGVELRPILQSLRELDEKGGSTRLRCPIIPTVNDTTNHARAIADLANTLRNVQGIDLIPYHSMGNAKTAALGEQTRDFGPLPPDHLQALQAEIAGRTKVPLSVLGMKC